MSRQGIDLDRSTLADWVGRAALELRPVRPSRPSMPKTRRMALLVSSMPNPVQPIAALSLHIFHVSKRSSSREA